MSYLLDANTFIEAKNTYYHMSICPGYWRWIEGQSLVGGVASVESVRDELIDGNDELKTWAQHNKSVFLSVSDAATQEAFAQVADYAAKLAPAMKPGALNEFLAGADPWLLAKAMSMSNGSASAIVVTHEKFNPDIKRKILLPNVCKHFDVPYMNTFDLLLKLKAEFVLAS